MHSQFSLEFRPIAPDMSRSSGYQAACTCGRWTYDGVIRNPNDPGEAGPVNAAWEWHRQADDD